MTYKWDNKKPTAQMLGRWQPFHDGHYTLFKEILKKKGNYVVWVDTIKEGRFDDTNKMFVKPDKFDFHVTSQDAKNWAPKIFKDIKK